MPYTTLITGAASGIGRCFAQHYLEQPDTSVIACDINDISISLLPEHNTQQLQTYKVDFASEISITDLVAAISRDLAARHGKIDLVIHSAGIRGLVPEIERADPSDVAGAETLSVMNSSTMMQTYQINTLGTFTLLQQLAVAGLLHMPDAGSQSHTKVVIMTSRMGSISYNTAGGAYAYRASKAALNAIVKSMVLDLPHVAFALIHPGRVETRLTLLREEGAIEVEESVKDMLVLIDKLSLKDSGAYVDRFGKDIGW